MVQVVVGLAVVAWLPAMAWWYWWRSAHRRPTGPELEKLRTSVALSRLILAGFVVLAAMQGATAALTGEGDQWWTAAVLAGSVLVSLPAVVLARRELDGSRTGPSVDLDRRVARVRRWTVPVSVAGAALAGLPLLGRDTSLVEVLVGPVLLGVFLFAVLTAMRIAIERSVRPPR